MTSEITQSKNNLFPYSTGEENLAFSLILDAKETILAEDEFYFEEIDWIMSEEEEKPDCVTFKNCCDILSVNHETMRLQILEEIKRCKKEKQ